MTTTVTVEHKGGSHAVDVQVFNESPVNVSDDGTHYSTSTLCSSQRLFLKGDSHTLYIYGGQSIKIVEVK
jgi:hypothetical protein